MRFEYFLFIAETLLSIKTKKKNILPNQKQPSAILSKIEAIYLMNKNFNTRLFIKVKYVKFQLQKKD